MKLLSSSRMPAYPAFHDLVLGHSWCHKQCREAPVASSSVRQRETSVQRSPTRHAIICVRNETLTMFSMLETVVCSAVMLGWQASDTDCVVTNQSFLGQKSESAIPTLPGESVSGIRWCHAADSRIVITSGCSTLRTRYGGKGNFMWRSA